MSTPFLAGLGLASMVAVVITRRAPQGKTDLLSGAECVASSRRECRYALDEQRRIRRHSAACSSALIALTISGALDNMTRLSRASIPAGEELNAPQESPKHRVVVSARPPANGPMRCATR